MINATFRLVLSLRIREKGKNSMNIAIVGASGAVGQQLIDRADRLYVTLVDHTFPDTDTHFPDIDPAEWQLTREEPHPADQSNAFPYTFTTLERRKS